MRIIDIKQPSKDCLAIDKDPDSNDRLKSKINSTIKGTANIMNSQDYEENDSIPPYDDPLY